MRSKLSLIIALLGAGAFMAACKQPSDPSRQRSGSSGSANGDSAEGDDTTGVIIRNGLEPSFYHANKGELETRMGEPLAELPLLAPHSGLLRGGFAAILGMSMTDGLKLVDYAVDCAVTDNVARSTADPSFGNTGALTTTAGWTTSPLPAVSAFPNQGPRTDLHTCLATRLNPTGALVQIFLRGQSVVRRNSSSGFAVPEAYWATIGQGANGQIHFWPSKVVGDACGRVQVNPGERSPVQKRVCGLSGSNCNLHERKDRSDCSPLSHGMACLDTPGGTNKIPVIETMIKCSDWGAFYPPPCLIPEVCQHAGAPGAGP